MAFDGHTIGVVTPCFKVADKIAKVVAGLPDFVDHVIVVDDACPQDSGAVAEAIGDPRLEVARHDANQGVGGAVVTGYRRARELGCDIVVKIDGDDQMDPARMADLVRPLAKNAADYAKGNRFHDFAALRAMPRMRLFGNSLLSFWIKAASGYWNLFDPTNGYTAIRAEWLDRLTLERIDKGYFFESDMLIRLNALGAVVHDAPMPARYGSENSSLRLRRVLFGFPLKIIRGALRRVLLRYFLYDFNMGSVYLLLGLPLFVFGVGFGAVEWIDAIATGEPRPVGTVMLVVLPIILGFQMLLQAISIDIASVPRRDG